MNRYNYDYYNCYREMDDQEWMIQELYYPEQGDSGRPPYPPYEPSSPCGDPFAFYKEENEYAARYGLYDDEDYLFDDEDEEEDEMWEE